MQFYFVKGLEFLKTELVYTIEKGFHTGSSFGLLLN